MKPLRYFLDTHDPALGSFSEKPSAEEFQIFFQQYRQAIAGN